jgi:hypothetical protein
LYVKYFCNDGDDKKDDVGEKDVINGGGGKVTEVRWLYYNGGEDRCDDETKVMIKIV